MATVERMGSVGLELDMPLDEGIAFDFHVLRGAGIETMEYCEGGDGHPFKEPTPLDAASELGHTLSQCFALCGASTIALWNGDLVAARGFIDRLWTARPSTIWCSGAAGDAVSRSRFPSSLSTNRTGPAPTGSGAIR